MVPVGGALAMIFAPLPIMDYALGREDWLFRSIGAVVLATAVTGLAIGWPGGAAYLVTFGLGTIIICHMLENRRSFEMVVLVASAAMLIAGTFASFAAAGSPAALADAIRHALSTGMARGEEFYRMLGVESPLTAETRAAVLDITMRLSPALVALSAACAVLIDLMIFWRWLDRGRLGYRLFVDPARWSAPEWLIWVLLATGFALFVPVAAIATIALDVFVIVATIYFCQGLAIMSFYFKMLSMPGLARGLIYFVTAIQPVLAALVCAAGIFYLWVDFRRLKPQSPEAGSFGDFL
jgi:uncharacterized protein YybS (DUF2232 family)